MGRKRTVRLVTVLAVAAGTLGVGASAASATNADPHKVTICHATASQSNPYVTISVDVASIIGDSGHGHSGVNAGDIIPPFTVPGDASYAGNNWTDAGQAIFANGCGAVTTGTGGTGPVIND